MESLSEKWKRTHADMAERGVLVAWEPGGTHYHYENARGDVVDPQGGVLRLAPGLVECASCGEVFEPAKPRQAYCSDRCRVPAWRARQKASKA